MKLELQHPLIPYVDYEKYGSGSPVLFLGGGGSTVAYYKPFLEALGRNYSITGFNYPEFNTAVKVKGNISLDLYVAAVTSVLEALHLKSIPVVGHSMGGGLALTLGTLYPKLFTKICVIAPMLEAYPKSKLNLITTVTYNASSSDRKKDLIKQGELLPFVKVSVKNVPAILRQLDMLKYRFAVPREYAPTVQKLVILARNDVVFPFIDQMEKIQTMSQKTVLSLEDGGHEPMFPRMNELVTAITDFFSNTI